MTLINFAALERGTISTDPYPYLVIPDFLNPERASEISQAFPKVSFPGSVPLSDTAYGPVFAKLIEDLEGDVLRHLIESKFDVDLTGRPTLITVRGRTRDRDGKIHTDTKSKLITLLLYFNPEWRHSGGRLRILRSKNLEDFVCEIPPDFGTGLIFKVTDNCWHGHKPFEGERRAIQLNYLTDRAALQQHLAKHHTSAKIKNFKRWLSREDEY